MACAETAGWKYIIWQIEQGESGTPHIQGYGESANQATISAVCARLGGRAHVEVSRGSAVDNVRYVTKEPVGAWGCFSWGTPGAGQGAREDISAARDIVRSGGDMKLVVDKVDSYQAIRIAEVWLKYHEPVRQHKPTVVWLWGPTGAGKSRLAAKLAGEEAFWKDETKWWEGYDGHKAVVIDDFRATMWPLSYMLKLLDRYPCRVECKGGSRQCLAELIVITAPGPPERAYPASLEDQGQLLRRIDLCEEVSSHKSGVIVTRRDNIVDDSATPDFEDLLSGLL